MSNTVAETPHTAGGTALHPSPTPLRLNTILVPTDFSEPAKDALNHALGLAEQFGSTVVLVHAMELPYPYPIVPLTHFPGDMPPYPSADLKTSGEKTLETMREAAASAIKSPVRAIFRTGRAYEEIVGTARECAADLIVIATHGYTGMKHVFLGSTAERVVRHASCPVLVLRSHEGSPPV